jgi:hypothetical protein
MLFLMLPTISMISRFKGFAGFFLKLAAFPLSRAAVVVSEHNDAMFKQMEFQNIGLEEITIDGDNKLFEDPDNSLHHWLGIPFALADEEHGVLFDPRHAAAGAKKKLIDDRGDGEYLATTEEWEEYGISKWKPAVFEFPKKHVVANLSMVQELVDGGERSEYAERVEELYKHSRDPFGSGTSALTFLYPILGFAIPFGGIWFMASQFGVGGGGSGGSSVSFGFIALLLTPFGINLVDRLKGLLPGGGSDGDGDGGNDGPGLIDRIVSVDWRRIGAWACLLGSPLLILSLLVVVLGVVQAIAFVVVMLLGFAIMPLITILGKPSAAISGGLSKLYFKLGMLGYRKPVLEWTQEKYRLREADTMDIDESDVTWYSLFGSLIGFSFEPDERSWGAEYQSHEMLEAEKPVTDGGAAINSNLPGTVTQTNIKRGTYGGYLPKRLRDDHYYIHTGILLNRFSNSAIGEKSLRKLLEAKDEHGASNNGIADETIFKTTAIAGLFGALLGVGIFILPAFI